MSKYHSKKTEVCGITFDSKAEADRYLELHMLEHVGAIKDLALQVPFKVIEGKRWSNGRKHKDTKYIADFVYTDAETGEVIVEDVKGFRTDAYRLKAELMKERYNIEIREVRP